MGNTQRMHAAVGAPISVVGVQVDLAGLTHIGNVRPTNEDHFLVADLNRTLQVRGTSLPAAGRSRQAAQGKLLVVADGVGGNGGGDVASALVVETLEEQILNALPWFAGHIDGDELERRLRQGVEECAARVRTVAAERGRDPRMATTMTAALVCDYEMFVAHVGDSRCYLQRDGKVERLTRDHTYSELLGTDGYGHALYNDIGGRGIQFFVDLRRVRLRPGDRVLVCSDGLTRHVSDDAIADELAAAHGAGACCQELLAAALAGGGEDNVTVLVAML